MASNASIERGGTLCSCAARFPSKPCTTRMSVSGACERRWSRVVARRRRLHGSVSMRTRGQCMEDRGGEEEEGLTLGAILPHEADAKKTKTKNEHHGKKVRMMD